MEKITEERKNEILNIIKKNPQISIYQLKKLLPDIAGNSYGNIWNVVKILEKENLINITKEEVKTYKKIISLR